MTWHSRNEGKSHRVMPLAAHSEVCRCRLQAHNVLPHHTLLQYRAAHTAPRRPLTTACKPSTPYASTAQLIPRAYDHTMRQYRASSTRRRSSSAHPFRRQSDPTRRGLVAAYPRSYPGHSTADA
eukprot:2923588-Rhodomonas_salina.2